ncbi:hypothetical protein BFN03_17985 [Rhodococcus sp. WMMA185]|nr:hypothetical protein BFN03_17985 [Rhodococcus sp. WMMA185]
MTKPACDSMTNHRRPDSLTHDESESGTAIAHQLARLYTVKCMYNQVTSTNPATASYGQGKIRMTT